MQTVVLYYLPYQLLSGCLCQAIQRDRCSIRCYMIVYRNTNYLSIPHSLYNHLQTHSSV